MEMMPKAPKWRPDFMSPGRHVNISSKGELAFATTEILDEGEDQDLSGDFPKHKYYESDKVLGKLFRNIDERKIFKQIKSHSAAYESPLNTTVIHKVWSYVKHSCYGFQWDHLLEEARNIRDV